MHDDISVWDDTRGVLEWSDITVEDFRWRGHGDCLEMEWLELSKSGRTACCPMFIEICDGHFHPFEMIA